MQQTAARNKCHVRLGYRSFCDVFDVSLKLGEGILASGYAREVLPFIAYWMVLPLLHICGWHIDSASCTVR